MKKLFRKINKYLLISLISTVAFVACDDGFGELNTNPNTSDQLGTEYLLSYSLLKPAREQFESWRGNLIYCSEWVQHLAGNYAPDRYITTNEEWLSAQWQESYIFYGKNLQDIINRENGTNIQAMAIIFKSFIMQRTTDMYGDIPYTQAFQGGENPNPEFDTQEVVYNTMINDLTTAINQLQPGNGQNPANFDILYGGDIDKWKKFGNSVLLRVGMRLSEVNPALAEQTVVAALDGGVFTSNEDIAYVPFSGTSADGPHASGISEVFQDQGFGGGDFAYSDEFVSRIVDNNDPRESTLMESYNEDGSVNTSVGPGNHVGRPNGVVGVATLSFALPKNDVMVAYNSPILYLTFAEVEFIRAEAIQRGWVGGDVSEAYASGITAACKHLTLYPNTTEISDADIAAYIAQPSIAINAINAIEQINTQKWIALIFDGYEAYANYRRIGFPTLTPGANGGEGDGSIPKRLRYPAIERESNAANYNAAVGRLSNGDVITSNVWWDVN